MNDKYTKTSLVTSRSTENLRIKNILSGVINLKIAGLDNMFANGTFGVVEFLYNGGYGRRSGEVLMITEPLRPDNIMFSKYPVTLSAQRSFSPILQGGLAAMALTDIDAVFLMPSMDYSLSRDLDLEFIGQIFLGGSGTIFEEAGSAIFFSLQYSF